MLRAKTSAAPACHRRRACPAVRSFRRPFPCVRSSLGDGGRRGAFGLRYPTDAEADAALLKDMTSAAKVVSDGVCVFVIVFCGLNWLSYRRRRIESEKDGGQTVHRWVVPPGAPCGVVPPGAPCGVPVWGAPWCPAWCPVILVKLLPGVCGRGCPARAPERKG